MKALTSLVVVLSLIGCSSLGESPEGTPGSGGSAGSSGSGSGGKAAGGGSSGTSGGSGSGGASSVGGSSGKGGGGSPGTGGTGEPITCSEAASEYTVSSAAFDASLVPYAASRSWGSNLFAQVPVAVDAASGRTVIGFTREEGDGFSAAIVPEGGAAADVLSIAGAVLGGVAVTTDGLAALIFDPSAVDERVWAAVKRFDAGGAESFSTDLFRSPNLDDEGTKGAPSTSRLGYSAASDTLVAYFGHTQRYDDGVRHQGGYLAALSASGEQDLLSGWFGSHNLDQRLVVDGSLIGVLGLGDAYPKGVFFSFLDDPETNVLYTMAGNGSGTTNGQLGGMVALDDAVVVPFITNRSISQDLTPGDWPDIDPAISDQIEEAASNGNEIGLLLVPKTGSPPENLEPIWLDPGLTAGARLESLKSARYGTGGLVLLAWAEVSGSGNGATRRFYTMVVDGAGAVCQAKRELDAQHAFTSGDDIVLRPDGSIVWGSVASGSLSLITLTPG